MQEEIAKHIRKIYQTAKNSGHSLSQKVTDIVIEVFIIVLAVTLSIALHGWNEHRQQQKEVQEFLLDLKGDLKSDIENMNMQSEKLAKDIAKNMYLKSLTTSRIDSITNARSRFSISMGYVYRKTSVGNYEGFKSSGKIGFIENKELKKLILEYFQESMPMLEESEKKLNVQVGRLADLLGQKGGDMHWFLGAQFRSNIDFFIQDAGSTIEAYKAFTMQAKRIVEEIEKESSHTPGA
jgi:hypothetical protein